MKEEYYLLQTYEIFLKIMYLKLLQEYLNNEIIGFTDKTGEEESVYYTVTDIQRSEDGSCFISEDPARDGANWYGYAGQNPMVYVDKIGLFASNGFLRPYAAEQYNTTPEVGPQPTPNATPQNQTPNITGIKNSVDTLEIENDSNLLEQKKDSKTNKLSWQNVKYITFKF